MKAITQLALLLTILAIATGAQLTETPQRAPELLAGDAPYGAAHGSKPTVPDAIEHGRIEPPEPDPETLLRTMVVPSSGAAPRPASSRTAVSEHIRSPGRIYLLSHALLI